MHSAGKFQLDLIALQRLGYTKNLVKHLLGSCAKLSNLEESFGHSSIVESREALSFLRADTSNLILHQSHE